MKATQTEWEDFDSAGGWRQSIRVKSEATAIYQRNSDTDTGWYLYISDIREKSFGPYRTRALAKVMYELLL